MLDNIPFFSFLFGYFSQYRIITQIFEKEGVAGADGGWPLVLGGG
jgi:hypothetical protein